MMGLLRNTIFVSLRGAKRRSNLVLSSENKIAALPSVARNDTFGEFRNSSMIHYKRASILVLSVWVLAIFSILSLGLYRIVFSQIKLAKAIEERVICQYLAKAAVMYAQIKRQKDDTPYDTLYELRISQERELSRGKFSYVMIDEESKININTATEAIIAKLPGLNPELAKKVLVSTLKPFVVKEEILLVEGITEEIYNGFKDIITVYTDGKVNINTAGTDVLTVLGLDDALAEIIKKFRAGLDGEEATEDDEVFENTGEVVDKLRSYVGFSAEQEQALAALFSQGIITTDSKNFSLEINTQILDKSAMKYNIVMDKDRIKQWMEY